MLGGGGTVGWTTSRRLEQFLNLREMENGLGGW